MGKIKGSKFLVITLSSALILFFIIFFVIKIFFKEEERHDITITYLYHSPTSPETLYALTDAKGVLKSIDGGKSWNPINKGLITYRITTIVESPSDPAILYIGTNGAGVYKSEDGGNLWREINEGLTNTTVREMLSDPAAPDRPYLLTLHGGVFRWNSQGGRWLAFGRGLPHLDLNNFYTLLFVPSNPPTLFLGSYRGLYKIAINSDTWVPVREFEGEGMIVKAMAYDRAKDTVYVAAGFRGKVFKSHDKGETWSPPGDETGGIIESLIVVPGTSIIYAGTSGAGVLKSMDDGVSWKVINKGIPDKMIQTLAVSPKDPEILYAGFWGWGVYKSRDGGTRWRSINQAFPRYSDLDFPFLSSTPRETSKYISMPKAFDKCNVCHGWFDPFLHTRPNTFRVGGTPRDWEYTVKRMSAHYYIYIAPSLKEALKIAPKETMLDAFSPEEEAIITKFLNAYYGTPAR